MHAGLQELRLGRALLSGYDELRDFLRPRTRHNQHVPADRRRLLTSVVPPLRSQSSVPRSLNSSCSSRRQVWRER
jgi:hypothetical protein